jgi:hypothetical protein
MPLEKPLVVLTPGELLALKSGIDWVQIGTGGQDMVVSYWSGSQEHKITYANNFEAIVAINEWELAMNGPPVVGPIVQPGDEVQVSHNTHARGALGEQFSATLVAFPTTGFPFWVVRTASATMYMENVTVSHLL